MFVATYAPCFLPAFHVGRQKTGFDDLGKAQIDVNADFDDSDDLERIGFDVYVESDLSDDGSTEITELAEDICHIHDAPYDEL